MLLEPMQMELLITPNGEIRCVYSEAIPLDQLGRLEIQRGSHVEPTVQGQWTADMSPVNGPVLGPFDLRSVALHAERDWLHQHWLQPPLAETNSPGC